MDVRRIVFWVLVLGVLAWVVKSPANAGHTVSHWANLALGAGENLVEAFITFVSGVV
jgi:hypothetical protein